MEDPLAQFNHTMPERGSVWELIRTLNNCLTVDALDERILNQVLSTYWGQFASQFAKILEENPESERSEPRAKEEIFAEILENTRHMNFRLQRLESRSKRSMLNNESRPFFVDEKPNISDAVDFYHQLRESGGV